MEFLTPVPIPISRRILYFLFFFTLIVCIKSASSSLPDDCTGEIVRFSNCLPYVASYPNNLSSSASSSCCDSFSSAFTAGDGVCFCYLLRQPLVLGFAVNTTRILSLSSVCASENASSVTNTSLGTLCAGSPALPPLQSGSIGPAFTNPNAPPVPAESGSPSTSITVTPEEADNFHAPIKAPGLHFFAAGHICRSDFLFYFATFWMAFMMLSSL
ncbi:hypothetical protein QQ045_007204 [Rhodiola kirilowii]